MLPNYEKVKIAFQGMNGAYSNMAAQACFPNAIYLPCTSFEEMLEMTKTGVTNFSMVPVENSVAGRVADIHNLLPESGLYIVAEHFQKVNHQLMALPGVKIEDLKKVKSHAQGLAQCRNIIKKLKLETIQHLDTAGAAYDISQNSDKTEAAIASKMAAKIYGLDIILENIEDANHNTTRFLVMSKNHLIPNVSSKTTVTTIIFEVKSVPAALYKVLGGFATNGINLTKLESYIGGQNMEAARFYVDAEGHPDTIAMRNAIEEMKFYTMPNSINILGSFERNK